MNKVAVVYWTSTGNTQAMAEAFAAALDVNPMHVSEFDVASIDEFSHVALGCPACGEEELDDTEFLPFFESILPHLSGKHVALFGSYGWGDGEWMRNWEEQVKSADAILFESGQIVLETPDNDALSELETFAQRFVA